MFMNEEQIKRCNSAKFGPMSQRYRKLNDKHHKMSDIVTHNLDAIDENNPIGEGAINSVFAVNNGVVMRRAHRDEDKNAKTSGNSKNKIIRL